ncbi:MAG: Lead, cadmium, zinc and mercury transporting ATPase [Ignavibacteriae bacterium]|nr:MAG: Lead, cadmium, zinc and mercury transporting ATPase [Ignavibacteriota bacterium]
MKKLKLFLTTSLMMLIISSISFSQAVGDYGSAGSGNWGTTGANWLVCVTPGTWDGATPAPGAPDSTKNVWIRLGHTVLVETSPKYCNNLTVESGAKLWCNSSVTNPRYLRFYGNTFTNDGVVGGTNDALGLYFPNQGQTITLTGSGTYDISRVQLQNTEQTVIFDANVNIYYAGSQGAGSTGLYANNKDNTTFTINAGKTVTMATRSYIAVHSSSGSSAGTANFTLNVYGTLTTGGTAHINLNNSSGKTSTLNIYDGGVINVGDTANIRADVSGATYNINIYEGGTLNGGNYNGGQINLSQASTIVNGTVDFKGTSTSTRTIGTATVGATGKLRFKDGTYPTGSITLNSGSTIEYYGTSGFTMPASPSTYSNLQINNSGGVTLGSNVTINGVLSISGGTFNTGTNTVTVNGTVQINDGGWATGQDFVYNSGSTLVFNTTSQYGVGSDHVYWPWNNGPTNVSIVGSGGIKLNAWRPVNGLFQTWAGVEIPNGEKLIANGQVKINTGGYFSNQGPEYGSSSKLIYATGSGGYNTWLEWPSVNGPANVEITNGTPVTLTESKSISGVLDITSGQIILGSYNLTVGSIGNASANGYVVTNGTGSLIRNVGSSNVLFPVGTVSSYNPVTINNAGTGDDFSVRVKSSFDNPPVNSNKVVNRQWTITEATPGGSDATITFQWNAAEEASGFDRAAGIEIGRWTGTQWEGLPAIFVGGSDPYSAYVGNVSSFSDFAVGNSGALPVQLASFIGNIFATGKAKLEWQTISEKNNAGFYVEKYNSSINDFVTVSELIPGAGTTLQPQSYSWIDENAVEENLQYRLKQMDMNGLYYYFGPIMLNPTGVNDNSVPAVFALYQNYPNPFNPTTTINFSIAEANYTTLKVYNILGSEVATLFAGDAEAGKMYSVKFDGSNLSSGIYLYKLQSGNNVEVRKLMLMK